MNFYSKLVTRVNKGVYCWDGFVDGVVPGDLVCPYPQVMESPGEKSYRLAQENETFFVISVTIDTEFNRMIVMAPDCSLWDIKWTSRRWMIDVG